MALKSTRKTVAQKTVARPSPTTPKEICFAIMPFGGWFDDYYNSIFRPAIESAGLIPKRADDLYRPSTIVNDIWAYTKQAKLVLADLTGKNPNVFYELGLCHALAKPAILVVESIDDVPFDLRALRVIEYDKNAPNWGTVLHDKIKNSIREVLESPTEAVLPAFLNVKDSKAAPSVTAHEKEILELRQDMELLRREVGSRRDIPRRDIPRPEYLSPVQATRRIREYIDKGAPNDYIVDAMIARGLEPEHSLGIIERLRKTREAQKGSLSATSLETK